VKKIFFYLNLAALTLILVVFLINWNVKKSTEEQLYNDVDKIPHKKVGLLLGTSKYAVSGNINLYYKYRIEAATQLFKARKITYVLVSGDNGSKNYDEPTKMKTDLVEAGVPEDRIILDYAGFRTLDSVVRAEEVFQTTSYILISQQFHNERGLYLANYFDHSAIGFNAKGVSYRYGFKVQIREYFARVKMVIDLVLGIKPKYLGKKIDISLSN